MKYYVAQGTTPVGPFEIEELAANGLCSPDTLVWAPGMPDWVAATTVPELEGLFEQLPPPLTPPAVPCSPEPPAMPVGIEAPVIEEQRPFDWLWPSIVVAVCCCSPLAIVGIIYAAQVSSCWNRGDYDTARRNASRAKIWTIVAIVLGIVGNIVYALAQPALMSAFDL